MIYLVPRRWLLAQCKNAKQRGIYGKALAFPGLMKDGEKIIALVGRPAWKSKVAERTGLSVEEFVANRLIPHEMLHIVFEAIGEKEASKGLDRRWPTSVPTPITFGGPNVHEAEGEKSTRDG